MSLFALFDQFTRLLHRFNGSDKHPLEANRAALEASACRERLRQHHLAGWRSSLGV